MANYAVEDLAYAAGILDGEGTVGITEIKPRWVEGDRARHRRSPTIKAYVAVCMSDSLIPVWLAETFDGPVNSYQPPNPRHRMAYRWQLQGQRAAEFLGHVAPFMRLKRAQAELVIAYYADPRFVFKQRQGIPDAEIEARRVYAVRARALNAREGGQ